MIWSARRSLCGIWLGLCAAWLGPSTAPASQAGLPSPAVVELGPRNYTQRAANKLRDGSLIRAEGGQVRTQVVDLRGTLGRRRDLELGRHYGRMAEMDVIAELAEKHHRVVLAELVDTVRRKETERFFWAMQQIRLQSASFVGNIAAPSDPAKVDEKDGGTSGATYRQAVESARQRLTLDSVQTRLDDLDLQIDRERDTNR